MKVSTFYTGKSIAIIGGTGSWGQELTKQLLIRKPKLIRIVSRQEHRQVTMKRTFQNPHIQYLIGDVRDRERIHFALRDIDYVFHLAALKHVPVCEENPWEAVQTNIVGTNNIIDAAVDNQVKKVIYVSSDKAVAPHNMYGITKAAGEKLIITANTLSTQTRFLCFRGGNVIGTNGSVVPLFKEQIQSINEITITDMEMTRFFIRLSDTIESLIESSSIGRGGETFIPHIATCRIQDLAEVMIEHLGNKKTKINIIGIRPGEKMSELLISPYEAERTFLLKQWYVILPPEHIFQKHPIYAKKAVLVKNTYASDQKPFLKKNEIVSLLQSEGWLNQQPSYLFPEVTTKSKKQLLHIFETEGWTRKK